MDVGARCGGHRRRLGPRCRLILATVSSPPSRARPPSEPRAPDRPHARGRPRPRPDPRRGRRRPASRHLGRPVHRLLPTGGPRGLLVRVRAAGVRARRADGAAARRAPGAATTLRIAIVVSRVRAEGRPRADSGPMVLEVPLDAGWGTRFHRYHLLEGRRATRRRAARDRDQPAAGRPARRRRRRPHRARAVRAGPDRRRRQRWVAAGAGRAVGDPHRHRHRAPPRGPRGAAGRAGRDDRGVQPGAHRVHPGLLARARGPGGRALRHRHRGRPHRRAGGSCRLRVGRPRARAHGGGRLAGGRPGRARALHPDRGDRALRAGRHRRRRRRGAPRVRAAPRRRVSIRPIEPRCGRSGCGGRRWPRRTSSAPRRSSGRGGGGARSSRSSARPSSRSASRVGPIPTRGSTSRACVVAAGGGRRAPGRRRGPVRRRAARVVERTAGTTAPSRRAGAAGWWSGSPRPARRPGR